MKTKIVYILEDGDTVYDAAKEAATADLHLSEWLAVPLAEWNDRRASVEYDSEGKYVG